KEMCSIKNNIIIASILLVIICKLNDASNGGGRGGRRAGRGGRGRTQENSVDDQLLAQQIQALQQRFIATGTTGVDILTDLQNQAQDARNLYRSYESVQGINQAAVNFLT
uniref:Uncharacterized protein n=1 Tax=Meloidogyne javanica TaxID=6303 RepID=A0A915M5H2_MELJA